MTLTNFQLVSELKNGNIEVFEQIFHTYSKKLRRFAFEYVANDDEASDIMQNSFLTLWERKGSLTPETNLNNYLFTLIKNQCLNYLKHLKAQSNYTKGEEVISKELLLNYYALERFDGDKLIFEELSKTIERAIDSLPGQCREIFMMSRYEELKYHEIAERLNISVKTVEKKMSISLNILRLALKEFYFFLFILP